MEKKYCKFQGIDTDRNLTKKTDYEFWYHLEHALLLALRERGTLSPMQYRQAEGKLQQQRRSRAKMLMERGSE